MADILNREPPFKGQRGYKGAAIFEKLFWSRVDYDQNTDE